MAKQRSPCRLQGEIGVQSPRRGGFSFCVGSFGPIAVDSDLTFLGTTAGIEAPGGASSNRRRGGGPGAAGAVAGAEAWSEVRVDTGGGAEGSRAPGYGSELAGDQAAAGGEAFAGTANVPFRNGSPASSSTASSALEQEASAAGAGSLRAEGGTCAADPQSSCTAAEIASRRLRGV
nr:uncharacterized protein LOC127315120 [Lolium perenne]